MWNLNKVPPALHASCWLESLAALLWHSLLASVIPHLTRARHAKHPTGHRGAMGHCSSLQSQAQLQGWEGQPSSAAGGSSLPIPLLEDIHCSCATQAFLRAEHQQGLAEDQEPQP